MADPAAPKPEAPQIDDAALFDFVLEKALAGAPFNAKEIRDLVGNANFSRKFIVQRLEQGSGAGDPGILTRLLDSNIIALDASGNFVLQPAFTGLSLDDFKKRVSEILNPPAPAPAAPIIEPFAPNEAALDAVEPKPRATPFDAKEALADTSFVAWVQENDAAIGFKADDLSGSDAAKREAAATYYDAYRARPELAIAVKKFLGDEINRLGPEVRKNVVSEENFGASIEEYLAKSLLEKPKRILRMRDLVESQSGLAEEADKLSEEATEKIEKLAARQMKSSDLAALAEEKLLLEEVAKVGTGGLADWGSKVMGGVDKALQKIDKALNFLSKDYKPNEIKFANSKEILGGLVRSQKETDAILAYEEFQKARNRHDRLSSDFVAKRLAEITDLQAKGAAAPGEIKAIKQELAEAKEKLWQTRGAATGALRITEIAKESAEKAVASHLAKLLEGATIPPGGDKKFKKTTEAFAVVKALKTGLDATLSPTVADAENKLRGALQGAVEAKIKENVADLEKPTAEDVLHALKQPIELLIAEQFSFGSLSRDEYRALLVASINRSADLLLKDKAAAAASLLRSVAVDVKNAAPKDKSLMERLKAVASVKKKKKAQEDDDE